MRMILTGLFSMALVAGAAAGRLADERSPLLAKELVTLMSGHSLQVVAARDPEAPDRFVAAMAFPGVQLLVVAARYPSPDLVANQIARRQYDGVYAELQEASVKESKLFFQDMGADGIAAGAGNVDVMYERGVDQMLFDGNWKRAHLSKAAYDAKIAGADTQYSRLLEVLIAALKQAS